MTVAARAIDEFELQQADGRMVRGRRAGDRRCAERLGPGERRQSALSVDCAARSRPIGPNEMLLLDLWGKLPRPARCLQTSRGWVTPARRVPDEVREAHSPRRGTAGTRRSSWSRPRRGTAPTCAGGRWTARAATSSTAPGSARVHPSDRPQPRRGSARQRRAHGRLRNARRPAADPRHRIHDRAGRLYGSFRRAHGNQHVHRGAGRTRDGSAPDRRS